LQQGRTDATEEESVAVAVTKALQWGSDESISYLLDGEESKKCAYIYPAMVCATRAHDRTCEIMGPWTVERHGAVLASMLGSERFVTERTPVSAVLKRAYKHVLQHTYVPNSGKVKQMQERLLLLEASVNERLLHAGQAENASQAASSVPLGDDSATYDTMREMLHFDVGTWREHVLMHSVVTSPALLSITASEFKRLCQDACNMVSKAFVATMMNTLDQHVRNAATVMSVMKYCKQIFVREFAVRASDQVVLHMLEDDQDTAGNPLASIAVWNPRIRWNAEAQLRCLERIDNAHLIYTEFDRWRPCAHDACAVKCWARAF